MKGERDGRRDTGGGEPGRNRAHGQLLRDRRPDTADGGVRETRGPVALVDHQAFDVGMFPHFCDESHSALASSGQRGDASYVVRV